MDIEKLKLELLSIDNFKEIVDLEKKSMNTETTYPWDEKDLKEAFLDNKYVIFGYHFNNKLISKVGFKKIINNEMEWWELDISTDPDFQGIGIGKKIIKESLFIFAGNRNIFLKVHPENRALKLYKDVGFVEYKREKTKNEPRIIMDYKQ